MYIISSAFLKPILELKHINRFKVLPLTATTSPSAAKEYFLEEFEDSKEELKSVPLKPMMILPVMRRPSVVPRQPSSVYPFLHLSTQACFPFSRLMPFS